MLGFDWHGFPTNRDDGYLNGGLPAPSAVLRQGLCMKQTPTRLYVQPRGKDPDGRNILPNTTPYPKYWRLKDGQGGRRKNKPGTQVPSVKKVEAAPKGKKKEVQKKKKKKGRNYYFCTLDYKWARGWG